MKSLALSLLAPVLVGPVTFLLMQYLKKASGWVETQPSTVKRLLVAVIAFVLTFLAHLTGVTLPCDVNSGINCLATLDNDAVKALVASALAYLIHGTKKTFGK